jgi:hypothetical protein
MTPRPTMRPVDVILIWEDETRIILHYVFKAPWTWHDFYAALYRGARLAAQADGRAIQNVIDLTRSHFIWPGALTPFLQAARLFPDDPDRPSSIVFVNAPVMLQAIASVVCRQYPHMKAHIHYTDSVQSAYRLLERLKRSMADTQEIHIRPA